MLLERNYINSPIKENLSPERIGSLRKQTEIIVELVQILKKHQIPVPQSILEKGSAKEAGFSEIKLHKISSKSGFNVNRLNIQLNDVKFQLKKAEEDFAQYKVLARIDKQKLTKKYLAEISLLKKKNEEDNSNWEQRYTEKCHQFTQDKLNSLKQFQAQFQSKLETQIATFEKNYQQQIESLKQTVNFLSSQIKNEQNLHIIQTEQLIEQCQKSKAQELRNAKIFSTEKQKQLTKKLEEKICLIQLESKTDLKKLQQSLEKLQLENASLNNQIYFLKKEKEDFATNLKAKDRKILQLEMAVRAKQQVYIDTLTQFQSQKKYIQQIHHQNTKLIKESHSKEIQQLMSQQVNELDSFYQRINNLEQRKRESQEIMSGQMVILQKKISGSHSKIEEKQEIERLRRTIFVKEKELLKYQQDLKQSELLRQNNQKNYNRIFSAKSSRRVIVKQKQKSSSSQREKEIFKPSQTADLKVILKICNKDF